MKIVHAVYSMEVGGAEMLVAQLCRMQRAAGHEVTVCAYSTLGVLGEALQNDGIPVLVLGVAHPAKTMLRYWQIFREMRPDVVHCHNPAPTLQAALAARSAGASSVIATRHSLVSPPYDIAAELKFSAIARSLDWIVGICETTCVNLRGAPLAPVRKIVRVYNGAAAIEMSLQEPKSTDEFTLVFVGRLAEIKDLPTLIRAVALAAPRVPGLRLSVVGDGPVRGALEALTEDLRLKSRITFFGQQMEPSRFFNAADALVMSSRSEGLPMSLLQAMSAGKPAILTDVGGMGEVLRRSGGGIPVPVGDPAAMARAIVELASNPDLCRELGGRAKASYEQEFTLERMALAYADLYTSGRNRG